MTGAASLFSAAHVAALTFAPAAIPCDELNAVTASRVLPPYRPSISPGEQCARSSRICARRIADPALLAELSAGFFVASFVAAAENAGTATLRPCTRASQRSQPREGEELELQFGRCA